MSNAASTKTVLIVVTGDPRISPKPAEAVRIAAGVGVWKNLRVTLYLRGAAILGLSEFPDDLRDGDHFTRYLPVAAESGAICVERGSPLLEELWQPPVQAREIDDGELAALAANSDYVIRF